jgi:hypothetical protein
MVGSSPYVFWVDNWIVIIIKFFNYHLLLPTLGTSAEAVAGTRREDCLLVAVEL